MFNALHVVNYNKCNVNVKCIVNLSLENCIFPSDMKLAKITPLFKKGNM